MIWRSSRCLWESSRTASGTWAIAGFARAASSSDASGARLSRKRPCEQQFLAYLRP